MRALVQEGLLPKDRSERLSACHGCRQTAGGGRRLLPDLHSAQSGCKNTNRGIEQKGGEQPCFFVLRNKEHERKR